MLPFLQYSPDRDKRKELYMGYINRCNNGGDTDNKDIVDSLVNLRQRRAELLGYPDYASYVLENNMAKNPANVYAFLDEIWTPALNRAKGELAEIESHQSSRKRRRQNRKLGLVVLCGKATQIQIRPR